MQPISRFHLSWPTLGALVLIISLSSFAWVHPSNAATQAAVIDEPAGQSRLAKLVGSWRAETTDVQQDMAFPTLLTFTSDGIVLADEPPAPFETTAHGAWAATSAQTASFTFLALVGSEKGQLSSEIKIVGTLQYDGKTDTWNGPFTVQVTDTAGKELLADHGTFKAQRITPPAPSQARDTLAMIEAFNTATNKHEVDTVLAYFTPDATVQFPNQPPPNVFKGKAEIRQWLEADAARNIHVSTENVQIKGDRITWVAMVDIDDLRPLGITLVGNVEVMVQGGKIASFSYILDDATLAKLQAIPTPTPEK